MALPGQYSNSTFASNLTLDSAHVSGVTTLASNVTLTVPAGKLVYLEGTINGNSGSKIVSYGKVIVAPGAVLNKVDVTVENGGTLVAEGKADQPITFDARGNAHGVRFNPGSSGTVRYAVFKNAGTGLYASGVLPVVERSTFITNGTGLSLNNVNNTTGRIYDNEFYANTAYGLSAGYSTVRVEQNTFQANGHGIFAVNATPWLSGNYIINHTGKGVMLVNNSPARLYGYNGGGGYNFLSGNATGLYADYGCNAAGNGNDVITVTPGGYSVEANGTAVVQVYDNYWGTTSGIDPSRFRATNGAQILYTPYATRPFTTWGQSAPALAPEADGAIATEERVGDVLIEGAGLEAAGRYDEAFARYQQAYDERPEGRTALLVQMAALFPRTGGDFRGWLDTGVRPGLKPDDPLYALTLELEHRFLVQAGRYDEALATLHTLLNRFGDLEPVRKHALYDLGYLHHTLLGNVAEGRRYFDALRAQYPADALAAHAAVLTSDAPVAPVAPLQARAATADVPADYALLGNYPNPFHGSTTIRFSVPERTHVTLAVFDLLGREVMRPVDGEMPAGTHDVRLEAAALASGVYLYRLDAGGFRSTRHMIAVH